MNWQDEYVCDCVCLSVHTLTGKWLELLTPNFVLGRNTLYASCGMPSLRSKGQDHAVIICCPYGLHVDRTA